jgi:MtrB/PioB family decaheme-associated outer membrane protein
VKFVRSGLFFGAIICALSALPVHAAAPTEEAAETAKKPRDPEEAKEAEAAAKAETEAPEAEETPDIEHHGKIEWGVRFFPKRPPYQDRAKFEGYGEIPPGFFVDKASLSLEHKDGYLAEFWASDVGLNNQDFLLQLSKPGNHYLTFEWSESPYLNSTKALTLYDTSNPAVLTIPDAIQTALEAGNDDVRRDTINANVRPITINVDRKTAKANVRYTPSPNWTIKLDFSNEERSGNQQFGAPIERFNAIETPAPVFYTTRNFSAGVEYVGTWTEDKRFSLNLTYAGSIFDNKYPSFIWDNPFSPPGDEPSQGRNSLAPDNQSHRVNLTGALDLPFDSRYVATFSSTRMTQNEPFIPFTINPDFAPLDNVSSLPARSLNGKIDQLLFNNVLTTRLDSDLTATARFRYLSMDNKTPRLVFDEWVQFDSDGESADRGNTRPGYKKTNSSVDLNWRIMPGWKVGGSLGWEHHDRQDADVKVTDEHSVKIFADIKPTDIEWLALRASALHAERRFDMYDALNNVGVIGHPPDGGNYPQSEFMRKFDLANRDRDKVEAFADFMFESGWTITPTAGWRNDDFGDRNAAGGELGLKNESYWKAGVEQSIPVTDEITLNVSYLRENYDRKIVNGESDEWGSHIHDVVDTFEGMLAVALGDELLPGDMNLELGYVYSHTNNRTDTYPLNGSGETSDPPFPDVTNDFQRLDATIKYDVDAEFVQSVGWEGEATIKLRYAYERNHMVNWQIDGIVPYMADVDSDADGSLFLAAINPNYEASILTAEFGFAW